MTKIQNYGEKFPNNEEFIERFENYLAPQSDKPMTINNKVKTIHVFLEYLKHKPASEITRNDVERYFSHVRRKD